MQAQQIEITIINWKKYNPKDMTENTPFWFRMENTINRSESLSGLSKIDKWHWVCLLGIASRKKNGRFVCDVGWLAVELMLRPRQILQLANKLFGKNLLTFELKTVKKQEVDLDADTPPTEQYNTIHNSNRSLRGERAQKKTDQKPASPSVAIAPTSANQVSSLIGIYVKSWQLRYGTNARPQVGGKEQGILKRLVKDDSVQNLAILIQAYCQMSDPWFEKKVHDLATFEQNLNKVSLALDKGRNNPTERTWEDIVDELERKKGVVNATECIQLSIGKT